MDGEQLGSVLTRRTPFPRLVRGADGSWRVTHRGLYAVCVAVFVLVIVWSAVVGEFGWRVDTKSLGHDEIGSLATSFNSMADKIDELVTASAKKADAESQKREVNLRLGGGHIGRKCAV